MREGKYVLVSNRLRRRVLALRMRGYDEYYRFLTKGPGRETEIQAFIDAVSTNETYFFRENRAFAALTQVVLPELLAARRRVRLWSAGCSTGEEPYTLRIVISEALGQGPSSAVEILATDINHQVVSAARRGAYGERSLRFVPPAVLDKWFDPVGDGAYRVKRSLAESIDFRVHALLKEPPPQKSFDIIFCRNVMIYFDKQTQARLADEYFGSVLAADGALFVGHAESLTGTSGLFRFRRVLGAPVYRRCGQEAAVR
jgi:chemotaxis protein methyltransferase CheR